MLEAEDMDENLFYKELTNTHFYSLFCQSAIVCIPHSKVIQGLAITRDIIETHCFQPSPYFRGQYVGTRQKQNIISVDPHSVTTMPGSHFGFKEKRTVHIIAEETYYLNTKRIRILSIDRLLQGEAPKSQQRQQQAIGIPPTRHFKTSDLEFLNMFPENHEAIHELKLAVQEFIGSYVYIKGYNRTTVERIQHIYINTCEIILQRNRLLRDSCCVPSEHEQFLELVENVVMGYLHKKIWHQTLKPLLCSQDTFVYHVCLSYSHVTTLAHYSIRYPLSEMSVACFEDAIDQFNQVDHVVTPLEKLSAVKSTLDLISGTVVEYIKEHGYENADTSVTADEIIPLLAFVIVQSNVTRVASLVYYLQYYRLVKTIEGSIQSFVVITLKAACEFLKGDPLSLESTDLSSLRSRSNSIHSSRSSMKPQHYKSQSIETFYNMVEPPAAPTSIPNTHHHLTSSAPVVSATFPSISSPLPYSNRVANQKAPDIIYLSKNKKDQQQDLGDFLTALSKMDDVVGARTGSFKIKH